MQDRLFEPLGLKHTELPPSSVNAIPAPYSHGYLYGSASVAFVGEVPYSEVWTNLPVSLDEVPTANTLMLKVLDQIYVVSPLTPTPSPSP
jgi:hypothetical protein